MAYRVAISLLTGLLVAMAQPAAAKLGGQPGTPTQKRAISATWYAVAMGQLQGRLALAHYWSSAEKFRAMTLINGRPILTIVNGAYYYTIDVAERIGVRIERNPLAISSDGRYPRPFAFEWEELMAAGGEKVRDETVGGRVAEVWQRTNSSGRRNVWVTREKPMVPIRVETYDRKTGRKDSVDYVNWQLGLELPDQFFEPSSDIEFQSFEYLEYIDAARRGPVGPAPPLYRRLLHGDRQGE